MFVARLVFSHHVAAKLARRGIGVDEVAQLPGNGALSKRNPHARVPGSRLLIGRTDGGRLLTVVVDPERADEAIWHVKTGWPSSAAEQMFYYRGS